MNPVEHSNGCHRRVMCQSYGRCLDLAIRQGWPGFSCERCSDFEPEDAETILGQIENVMALLQMILRPGGTKFRPRRSVLDDFM
jgi:hypothetical protein